MKVKGLEDWERTRLREIKYRDTRGYPSYPIQIGPFKQGPASLDELKSDIRFLLDIIEKQQRGEG